MLKLIACITLLCAHICLAYTMRSVRSVASMYRWHRSTSLVSKWSFNSIDYSLSPRLNVPQRKFSTADTSIGSSREALQVDNKKRVKKELSSNLPKFSDSITIVQTKEHARKILDIIYEVQRNSPNHIWACDTEVADIDLKVQGPIGNGKVICASVFGGPDVDFGDGPGTALWIDNLGESEGVLLEFKKFFEDPNINKCWHNYGFDRHVLHNEGINCQGFAGDTMHMARLWDTSRDRSFGTGEGFSLESLSDTLVKDDRLKKVSMKEIFGTAKQKKDLTESKIRVLPDDLRELQLKPEHRQKWIEYSAKDAVATWWVRYELELKLANMEWKPIDQSKSIGTLFDFYMAYLCEFGDLLTDMERNGIKVDTKVHLKNAEVLAREERKKMEAIFLSWAQNYCEDAKYINTASSAQIQQLLFGEYEGGNRIANDTRIFQIDKDEDDYIKEKEDTKSLNPYVELTTPDLKKMLKERGLKLTGKKNELVDRLLAHDDNTSRYATMDLVAIQDICTSRCLSSEGTKEELIERLQQDAKYAEEYYSAYQNANSATPRNKVKKYRDLAIKTIGMKPLQFTPGGQPQASAAILKKLAGSNLFGDEKDAVYGEAFKFFGGGESGKEACRAIGALANIGQIDATITNFLVPLQALPDKYGRIHCSLNLNTETGRLSARRPNLQNQPALEKDQYKIRDAFIAEPGNTLIVADYGQLELRLLAHITNCASMISAFEQGGCFHSRTAVGMYPHIKEAVETGKVLLEWDYSKGQPDVPLVKDTYASERRKAKTLNFSIAYGKTVHGLAADWGISTVEAQKTLSAWYNDRPEVKEWQERTREEAMRYGYVRTLMGRRRQLPDAKKRGPGQGHALRAAINTPIQGSAADVVMMAMIKLWQNRKLKDLGWKLLLQIHDEVILEGPKETKDIALAEVRSVMENPFDNHALSKLLVHLDVDAKSADSWYKAK